ncbi:MAG: hypothetical protein ACXAC7_20420 [Candidatus Hodarchaeales archaeon]|jgi:hypothetical protein
MAQLNLLNQKKISYRNLNEFKKIFSQIKNEQEINPNIISQLNTTISNLLPIINREEIKYLISYIGLSNNSTYLENILITTLTLFCEKAVTENVMTDIFSNIFTSNVSLELLLNIFDIYLIFIRDEIDSIKQERLFSILLNSITRETLSDHIKKRIPSIIHSFLFYNTSLTNIFETAVNLSSCKVHDDYYKQFPLIQFVLEIQSYETVPIFNEYIIWFLIGQTLATGSWSEHRIFLHSLIEQGIPLSLTTIDLTLKKILYNRPYTSPELLGKIIRNFCGAVIHFYGPDRILRYLLKWYQEEPIKDFRYAFHLSYISLMQEGFGAIMLNITADFIYAERDLDLLIKIFEQLFEFNEWYLLNYVVLRILGHQNYLVNYEEISKKILEPYIDDLYENANILYSTQEIFIEFWRTATTDIKKRLFEHLQKYLESPITSSTIKGILIQSLLRQTSQDDYWYQFLNQHLNNLGPLRVTILDDLVDESNLNSVQILHYDDLKTSIYSKKALASKDVNIFCLSCRKIIDNKKEITQTQCNTCLGVFCGDCIKLISEELNVVENKPKSCLGSSVYGIKHVFQTLST